MNTQKFRWCWGISLVFVASWTNTTTTSGHLRIVVTFCLILFSISLDLSFRTWKDSLWINRQVVGPRCHQSPVLPLDDGCVEWRGGEDCRGEDDQRRQSTLSHCYGDGERGERKSPDGWLPDGEAPWPMLDPGSDPNFCLDQWVGLEQVDEVPSLCVKSFFSN